MENNSVKKILRIVLILLIILIVGVGFLIYMGFKTEQNFSGITGPKNVTVYGTDEYQEESVGKGYIAKYATLFKAGGAALIDSAFIITAEGFTEILKDPDFAGLYINIGCEDLTKPKSIQLLFSGVKRDPGTGDLIKYLPTNPANGKASYLNKISPCPGPNCPK